MSRQNQLMVGAGSLLVALLALLFDNMIALEPDEPPRVGMFVVLGLICAAVAAGIYLLLLPRAKRASGPANRLSQAGFGVGLVALALVIVYWTALPIVLGAGAFVLGSLGEERARREMDRAPEGEDQADQDVDAEDADDQDGDQEGDEEEGPSVAERAGQAWAARVMGGLSFLACLVLFAIPSG